MDGMEPHVYQPSPEKIKKECEKLRAGWSQRDRANRTRLKPEPAFTRLVQTAIYGKLPDHQYDVGHEV